jgi:hypothetical protein
MEAIAKADRQFEHAAVCGKDEDVSGRVENCGADFTVLKVALHRLADFRGQGVVEIARNGIPNVLAF